jgi:hypothetical protein
MKEVRLPATVLAGPTSVVVTLATGLTVIEAVDWLLSDWPEKIVASFMLAVAVTGPRVGAVKVMVDDALAPTVRSAAAA